jgi:hypothetical protein
MPNASYWQAVGPTCGPDSVSRRGWPEARRWPSVRVTGAWRRPETAPPLSKPKTLSLKLCCHDHMKGLKKTVNSLGRFLSGTFDSETGLPSRARAHKTCIILYNRGCGRVRQCNASIWSLIIWDKRFTFWMTFIMNSATCLVRSATLHSVNLFIQLFYHVVSAVYVM